jgi:hypothetical protein
MYKIFYFINGNNIRMVSYTKNITDRKGIEIFQGTQIECADLMYKLGYRRSLRNLKRKNRKDTK